MSATTFTATSIPATRSGALDALRFVAATFVVLYHFGWNAPTPLAEVSSVFGRGWLATDFFLILSGYVLGRAYGVALDEGRMNWSGFFARRLARVWPAQLIVLFGLAALVIAASVVGVSHDPARFGLEDFFSQAALIHAWGVTQHAGWNEPSWTLSALIVCYAAFPAIWLACRPLNGRPAALVAGLSVLIAGAAFSLGALGLSLYDLPFHLGLARAAPLFVLGLFMARFMSGRRRSRAFAVASGLAALGALVTLQAAERTELVSFVSILAVAAIVLAADGLRLRSGRLTRAAADMSFALFISQALAGALWFGLADLTGQGHSWLVWSLGLAFTLGFAVAFHRLVDAPLQRRLRALLDRPTRPDRDLEASPAG
ncbi:acyltransferase [Brevundimonas sp.]|uniref:acyltransferase family protein n=1 Tax=Brevundimonas sp. TaxID=1871086 RepID=UPI0025E91669|nr:acyltransferase [Brevundimonas sp.]